MFVSTIDSTGHKENSPLDGKPDHGAVQQGCKHRRKTEFLPQAFEDQGGADAPCLQRNERTIPVSIDDLDCLGMFEERPCNVVEFAGFDQFVGFTEGCNHMLTDGLSFSAAFDDLEIGVVADLLDANEHVHPDAPHCMTYHIYLQYFNYQSVALQF